MDDLANFRAIGDALARTFRFVRHLSCDGRFPVLIPSGR
jgi:hypothetical protein